MLLMHVDYWEVYAYIQVLPGWGLVSQKVLRKGEGRQVNIEKDACGVLRSYLRRAGQACEGVLYISTR